MSQSDTKAKLGTGSGARVLPCPGERGQLHVHESAAELVESLARHFKEAAESSIRERGMFTVALSGGSTPKALYERLSQAPYADTIDWSKVRLFLGDERCVAHTDKESNYLMVKTALLSKIQIPETSVFPTHGQDQNPDQSASDYEKTLRREFSAPQAMPTFDLVFLGLGPDGHTASLFPESKALSETNRLYVANYVEKFQSWRLTMTYPLINNARTVIFIVSGQSKATILQEVLNDPAKHYPSQGIHPEKGDLFWFVDKEAARLLDLG